MSYPPHPFVARLLRLAQFALFSGVLAAPGQASDCSVTSVGLTPLNDLGPALYQGFSGGLYPGGANARPSAHEAAGLTQAAQVVPRNAAGTPDPGSGRIVLLTIGMSNTSQESTPFAYLVQQDPDRNPRLVVVNGAQGGQTASIIANPNANFWTVVDQRLAAAGLTPEQVQAVWYKEANANPIQPFPEDADTLRNQSARIMRIIKNRYPNTLLCYGSSRIYAGYASSSLNPEPYAYQSGFAIKRLIEDQIDGTPGLNFDTSAGPAVAPWLSWGPYLWADGLVPRSDGLIWECSDFNADGTHPSAQGAQKVAQMLLGFFKTDTTTRSWFLAPTSRVEESLPTPAAFRVFPARPNPFLSSVTIPFELAAENHLRAVILDPSGRVVRLLADGEYRSGRHALTWNRLDDGGRPVAAGVYWVRFESGGRVVGSVKTTLLR